MLRVWILVLVLFSLVHAVDHTWATAAEKSDDVFLDEGDGDFDSVPQAKVVKPSKSVEAAPAAKVAAPVAAPAETQPAAEVSPAELAKEKAPAASAAKKPIATKAVTPKKKSAPKEKHAGKKSAGIYVVTKGPCPMKREPASESEALITVKPAKKIWVEEVDAKWVRGFNKAGEPGYIDRSCLQ